MRRRALVQLNGVHHSARPTWKLKETVEFYRDKMGLPLIHCVSAKGWGNDNHPDFLHFFFDAGNGALIAFFYYLGMDEQPEHLIHHPKWDSDATHTAWNVDSLEDVALWKEKLETAGVDILFQIKHELVESIYFRDPNGYYLEIGTYTRGLTDLDIGDAQITVQTAIDLEESTGKRIPDMDTLYRAKGRAVSKLLEAAA